MVEKCFGKGCEDREKEVCGNSMNTRYDMVGLLMKYVYELTQRQ